MRVGFVGVGNIGRAMLEKVLSVGHDVSFFARRPEVAREVEALGATSRPSLAALAAGCDMVVVCVYSGQQVLDVCDGAEGLLASARDGAVIVIHSTCDPGIPAQLARAGRDRGVRVLDAAFSGGPADVAAGRLTLLVGGDAAVLEAVREPLAAYADPILPVGGLGDGQRVKLVNNALFGASVALVAEAERLATDLGLRPAAALEAISHCSGNSYALGLARMLGSSAALQEAAGHYIAKDVQTASELAAASGTDLGLLAVATGRAAPSEPESEPAAGGVRELWDIEQIKQLKARYFRYLDTKDWDGFRGLFTEDCEHYIPAEAGQVFQTNDEYFASVIPLLSAGVTTHHGHMPEIKLLSETEAEGIWAMHDYVQTEGPSGQVSIKGYGHYLETYRKGADGQWRISSKRNERLRVDPSPWTLPG
jgi:3-hydroxyisobutyrate dehydrogenase-like beta-hydroxyacid dehydrogenase